MNIKDFKFPQIKLDITSFKQRKPLELKEAIYDAFKQYDTSIIGTLPSKIIMTQRQYNILLKRPELAPMYFGGEEFQMYQVFDKKGKLRCVMELDVREEEELNQDVPKITVEKLEVNND